MSHFMMNQSTELEIPGSARRTDEDEDIPIKKVPKWKKLTVKGVPPSPRSGHSSVVGGHAMYVFGGRDGNTFKNDVFSFDFETRVWSEVATTGARPVPRYGHKAVQYSGQMVVFGGHAANSYLNDLLFLDLETKVWEKVEGFGSVPSPRWQYSMVVWRGWLIVFGGCDTNSYLNDLYFFDFERQTWQQIVIDDYSIPPTPRMMHGAIMSGERMIVFGGQCVDSIKNDLFEFNFEINTWNFIGVAEGRFRRNFACMEVAGNLLVFGGYSIGSALHNDMMLFDFDTGTWSTVEVQGKPPAARSGHSVVVYDERVYIFGGVAADGAQNDLSAMSLGYLVDSTPSNGFQVGSLSNDQEPPSPCFSPLMGTDFSGTSPLELNFLQRYRSASNIIGPDRDQQLLSTYNKDETPLILLFREEIQKLKEELDEVKKENVDLKRELSALKASKVEDPDILLY